MTVASRIDHFAKRIAQLPPEEYIGERPKDPVNGRKWDTYVTVRNLLFKWEDFDREMKDKNRSDEERKDVFIGELINFINRPPQDEQLRELEVINFNRRLGEGI